MTINDYAAQTIEAAQAQPENNSLLRVIWSLGTVTSPAPPSEAALLDAFRDSLETHASELRTLVLELSTANTLLDALEERLAALHELCAREDLALGAARDALLSELWTLLGGNRRKLRAFDLNRDLLLDLGEYRRRAAAHVAAAQQTVDAMSEEIEALRERVAAPDLAGDRIPVSVHVKSIRIGMERIQEQRKRAMERNEQMMGNVLGIEM